MSSIFDKQVSRSGLSTMKWESEINRTGNEELLCFGAADMDFTSAPPILDAVREVIYRGHLGYPYITQSYYDAIINWMKFANDWEIKKEWISSNVGIWSASWAIIDALSEPGDEIIYQAPAHFCFDTVIQESGRIPVVNKLVEKDAYYSIDFEDLESIITEKTKFFWLCNPHNPVGRAWRTEELEKLSEICLRNNVKIISDDVYCGLVYPGKKYIPIATVSKETSMNTITCYSTSKTYNTTGDKHCYVVCENSEILEKYNNSLKKQNFDFGVSVFGLAITEAAYNDCNDWLSELMVYVQENYELLKSSFEKELPLVKVNKPEATYFAWLDFRSLNITDDCLEKFLEQDANVAVAMGYKFLEGGQGFVRINMGCSRATLRAGLERIISACKKEFM